MLEMASIKQKKDVEVDGLSIVPLLNGNGKLKHRPIFCHFPHYVPATYNLPATYVREGDWKLLRFYGEGPGRSNHYELYNLKNDIGETKNLADKMPRKVEHLDALITKHLEDTGAIIPIKNPKYDSRLFNPITDKPIAGWMPSNDCKLAMKNGAMNISCFGKDPYLHTSEVPKSTGTVILKLRMKSNIKNPGVIYWGTDTAGHFHRSRSIGLAIKHNGQWEDYLLELPVVGKLSNLRIDPGAGNGNVEIDSIKLSKPDGAELKTWNFE